MNKPTTSLSRTKRVVFALIPTVLLFVSLVLVEITLRVALPSLAVPTVQRITAHGIDWYQLNRRRLEPYFPTRMSILPEMKPAVFRVVKRTNTVRVFCLGESTMFGVPYQMSATIPALVRTQLRHLYPSADIEVINAAASAINSNVIRDLAEELLQYEPDIVLLYSGHNEYYGPDGVGASTIERWFPAIIRTKYALRTLHLVRLIERWIGRPEDAGEVNMMQEVSRGSLVPAGSPAAQWIEDQFERNLRGIVDLCRVRGIPLVISDLTSNLQFAPFISSENNTPESNDQRRSAFQAMFDQGDIVALRPRATEAVQRDSTDALAHYWLGKIFLKERQIDSARRELTLSRDHDLLKFRSPSGTSARLAHVCREERIPLIAADSILSSRARDGVTGFDLFWEHLHPNAQGYSLIADEFVQRVRSVLDLDRRFGSPATGLLAFDRQRLAIAWLDEAFADYSMQALTSRWPFTGISVTPVALPLGDSIAQQIARDVYLRRLGWEDGCYRAASRLREIGRPDLAVTIYLALAQDIPFNHQSYYQLALTQRDMGNLDGAMKSYADAIRVNPGYPYARIDLGLLQVNRGEFQTARSHFRTAIDALRPDQRLELATAHYGLAAVAANLGQFEEALKELDTSLHSAPDYAAARTLRTQLLRLAASQRK